MAKQAKKDMNQGLVDHEADLEAIDAFGLDEFGAPAGLNPMWGAAVGAGLGTVASIALRQMSPASALGRHAEAVGFGLAAAASGVMIASKKSRAAGWTGLAAAFLNNGLRALEQYVMAPSMPALPASVPTSGVVMEPTTAFGIVDVEPTTAFSGGVGIHGSLGHGEMPQLVGASLQDASDHVQLVGGPALNRFAGHWGATHWNH